MKDEDIITLADKDMKEGIQSDERFLYWLDHGGKGSGSFKPEHGNDTCSEVSVAVDEDDWVTVETAYYGKDD